MNTSAYELLSAMARYWFIALALFILFRMILSVTREIRIEAAVSDEISEMGTGVTATLILISDEDRKIKSGKMFPVEGETTIGHAGKCDIALKSRSLRPVHCILNQGREGLFVVPVGDAFVALNGQSVIKKAVAGDGAELQCGGLVFRLRLEENDG